MDLPCRCLIQKIVYQCNFSSKITHTVLCINWALKLVYRKAKTLFNFSKLKNIWFKHISPLQSLIICKPTFTSVKPKCLSRLKSNPFCYLFTGKLSEWEKALFLLWFSIQAAWRFSLKLSTETENYSPKENESEKDQPEAQLSATETVGVENHRQARQFFLKVCWTFFSCAQVRTNACSHLGRSFPPSSSWTPTACNLEQVSCI